VKPLRAMAGSQECYNVVPVSLKRAVKVVAWSGRESSNPSSARCGCYRTKGDASVVLDAGKAMWMGGIMTAHLEGAWVNSYQVSYSLDTVTWRPLGGVYTGNVDDVSIQRNIFPFSVWARYLKVHVVDYFLWPSLRGAILEANSSFPFTTSAAGGNGTAAPATTSGDNYFVPPRITGAAFEYPGPGTLGAAACAKYPNMVVSGEPGNCTYACRKGTFDRSGACIGHPKPSKPIYHMAAGLRWTRRTPWSKLHCGSAHCAIETTFALDGPMAVTIDVSPALPWSRRAWELPSAWAAPPTSSYLVLPSKPRAGVHVRVWYNNSFVDIWHGRRISHDVYALGATGDRVEFQYGMGQWSAALEYVGAVGDSEALCSVRCPVGRLVNVSVAGSVLNVTQNCNATALSWLRNYTELMGADNVLRQFMTYDCGRGAEAWVVPRSDRRFIAQARVQATCDVKAKK